MVLLWGCGLYVIRLGYDTFNPADIFISVTYPVIWVQCREYRLDGLLCIPQLVAFHRLGSVQANGEVNGHRYCCLHIPRSEKNQSVQNSVYY